MKLISLKFTNFCGFKDFLFEPKGDDVVVYGDNATGKTTIYNGFLWLLFDKGSDFKSFNPKPLDENGKEINGLDNTVEGLLDIDGKTISLKKTMRELWVKKRGTGNKVFSGHETSYWINEVPCSQREYKNTVAAFAPSEDVFKLLSSPYYFASIIPWKKRRELLLDVVGDVSIEDVIKSVTGLSEIPKLLGDTYTVDEYMTLLNQRLSSLNRDLREIPVRIDEAESLKVDEKKLMPKATITKKMKELKEQLITLRNRRQAIKDSKSNTGFRQRIREIEIERAEIISEAESKVREKIMTFREDRQKLSLRLNKYRQIVEASEIAKDNVADIEARLVSLRQEYARVKDEEFVPVDEMKCSECGQLIPEKLQQASFMVRKSNSLAKINAEGKSLKAKVEHFNADVAAGENAVIEVQKLQAEINNLDYQIEHHSDIDDGYKNLIAEKDKEIEKLKNGDGLDDEELKKLNAEDERLKEEIELVKQENEKLIETKRIYESNKRIEKRIADLMKQEKNVVSNIEKFEGQKFLFEKFIKAKVSLLETRIEDALCFPGLSIKMFIENINGGLTECCEVLYNGVPFNSGLNHGAQIVVGMKIINLLSKHYDMLVPLFIDNSEAITSIPQIDTQIILLQVNNEYPELRVLDIPATDNPI
jgi:DNA repair exonuclease SbcCD ATPase subunit